MERVVHRPWAIWNQDYITAVTTIISSNSEQTAASSIYNNCNACWIPWNVEYVGETTGNIVYPPETAGTIALPPNVGIISEGHWVLWNQVYVTTTVTVTGNAWGRPEAELSEIELQLRREFEAEQRVRAEIDAKAALEAKVRARALLAENLSAAQRESLAKARHFIVHSPDGERRYEINQGRAGNVYLLDVEGKRIKRLCIHPTISCPDEDTMLAQKLLLEADEERFLRVANHTDLVRSA